MTRLRRTMMLLLTGILLLAGAPLEAMDLTAKDIWAYLPMDGTLDSVIPAAGMEQVRYFSAGKQSPEFVAGLNGRALRITQAGQVQYGIRHGLGPLPSNGAVMVWFKPRTDVARNLWLMQGNWAAFDMSIQDQRLFFYCSTQSEAVIAPLPDSAKEGWTNAWHCVIGSWEGSTRTLYFDGKRIGSLDRVEGGVPGSVGMDFGFLYGDTSRPASAYLDGDLDEVAIFRKPVGESEAREIAEKGTNGLLFALGGDVRGKLPRRAYVRGEPMTLQLMPQIDADTIQVSAVPGVSGREVPMATVPCKAGTVILDSTQLRPGRYILRLTAMKDRNVRLADDSLVIRVNATRTREFPVGIDTLAGLPEGVLETLSEWPISLTSGYRISASRKVDQLYLHGISTLSCLNVHSHEGWKPYLDQPEQYGGEGIAELYQVLRTEEDPSFRSSSLGSPFHPSARKTMLNMVQAAVEASEHHPGLHSLAFDDEYVLRAAMHPDTRHIMYGDYGDAAVAYFKEKTGIGRPVFPPRAPPGTVFPDDHPYLKWIEVIGIPLDSSAEGFRMNNAEQTARIHSLRPDVLTTSYSGGELGECDAIMDYSYPTIFQPYYGYMKGAASLDLLFDRHRFRQLGAPLKPGWGLTGWWSDNLKAAPDWVVQDFTLSTAMTVAKGARLIVWFTAFGTTPLDPDQLGQGLLSRPDLIAEMKRWAGWINRYGGMLARLEARPGGRAAVLFSDADRAGKMHLMGNSDFPSFYPAIRAAGLPVDMITDRQVVEGGLDSYEALILLDVKYSKRSVYDRIRQFAATEGKAVFCDPLTAEALRPPNAFLLSRDSKVAGPDLAAKVAVETTPGRTVNEAILNNFTDEVTLVRAEILPRLKPDRLKVEGSMLVGPHWLYGGEGRMLSLVNYNLFDAESVQVTLDETRGVVYDLLERKPVARSENGQPLRWTADIPKADWKPYVLLPEPIGAVEVQASCDGKHFDVTARVRDDKGGAIHAAIPVQVQLMQPDGTEVAAYGTFTASDAASGEAKVRIPVATLMDPKGEWRVAVTELVSGGKGEARVAVP